eukprot:3466666-Lingulodinium_polyedra.AAC.1
MDACAKKIEGFTKELEEQRMALARLQEEILDTEAKKKGAQEEWEVLRAKFVSCSAEQAGAGQQAETAEGNVEASVLE